jgi:prepilin-type N-terminal cleavage/methylation domain-containing protein
MKDKVGKSRNRAEALGEAAGFSLLEVMVATALMSLVLVMLLQVLAGGLRLRQAATTRTQAILVAEKICHDYSRPAVLKAGQYRGVEGAYSYVVEVEPQYQVVNEMLKAPIICYSLKVAISWKEFGQDRSLSLQTIRTVSQKSS